MSTTAETTHATTVEPTPTNNKLARLALEAGKYLDLDAGQRLPIEELYAQGKVNGYTDSEIGALLERDGLSSADALSVPEQGDLSGDLWSYDPSPTLDPFDLPDEYLVADYVVVTPKSYPSWEDRALTRADSCHPEPLDSTEDIYALHEPIALDAEDVGDSRYLEDGEPLTAFEAVGSYIERRHGEATSAERHGFHDNRHSRDRTAYAKGKEMDRQLVSTYANPTVALLSLRVSPSPQRRVTLLKAIDEAWSSLRDSLTYRLQKAPDAPLKASEWEYFAVIAGTAERGTPHLHIVVYCDGDVPRETFAPVVETFIEKCEYAPDDGRGNDPTEGTISIHGNGDDDILKRDDAPAETQAATYVLTQLPHLRDVDSMARDELLHASTVDASGVTHFRKSSYTVWNDGEKPEVKGDFDGDTTSSESHDLNQTERDFMEAYVSEVGDPDPDVINRFIDKNIGEFGSGGANAEGIRREVRERLSMSQNLTT